MELGHEDLVVGAVGLVLVVAFSVACGTGAIRSVAVLAPAGTVFAGAAVRSWVTHIVAPSGGRLVGAAAIDLPSEDLGLPGDWGLELAPDMQFAPSFPSCPKSPHPPLTSEILNVSFLPGIYTVYWYTCLTYLPTTITFIAPIILVP